MDLNPWKPIPSCNYLTLIPEDMDIVKLYLNKIAAAGSLLEKLDYLDRGLIGIPRSLTYSLNALSVLIENYRPCNDEELKIYERRGNEIINIAVELEELDWGISYKPMCSLNKKPCLVCMPAYQPTYQPIGFTLSNIGMIISCNTRQFPIGAPWEDLYEFMTKRISLRDYNANI
jgi:hypothetical protein